jgi:hypothetical protein
MCWNYFKHFSIHCSCHQQGEGRRRRMQLWHEVSHRVWSSRMHITCLNSRCSLLKDENDSLSLRTFTHSGSQLGTILIWSSWFYRSLYMCTIPVLRFRKFEKPSIDKFLSDKSVVANVIIVHEYLYLFPLHTIAVFQLKCNSWHLFWCRGLQQRLSPLLVSSSVALYNLIHQRHWWTESHIFCIYIINLPLRG